jgi:hypothetical protein
MILDKLCLRGKITTVHAEQIKEQLKSFIDQNFIGKEAMRDKVQKLHDNSESRTSELECSQDGYEFGLEDVLEQLK